MHSKGMSLKEKLNFLKDQVEKQQQVIMINNRLANMTKNAIVILESFLKEKGVIVEEELKSFMEKIKDQEKETPIIKEDK